MSRNISNIIKTDFNSRDISRVTPTCIDIWDELTNTHYRFNSDEIDHTVESNVYQAMPFESILLTDSETETQASLVIQNVLPAMGEEIRSYKGRIRCRMFIYDIETDAIIYDTKDLLVIKTIKGNLLNITGTLGPRLSEDEPVPYLRATEEICPGLYK